MFRLCVSTGPELRRLQLQQFVHKFLCTSGLEYWKFLARAGRRGESMGEELKQKFTRARLKAILEYELREEGRHDATSHVEIVPRLGYFVAIGHGDDLTIRLVQE